MLNIEEGKTSEIKNGCSIYDIQKMLFLLNTKYRLTNAEYRSNIYFINHLKFPV